MKEQRLLLTPAGLKKLEAELEQLKSVRRREVAERIKQAVEFGDITENAEYEEAKNAQAFIEGRILTLEKTLRNARVIEARDIGTEEVTIGSTVRVEDVDRGKVFEYTIVGSIEADPTANRISYESPVGRALLGQKRGDVVEIRVPIGILRYRITEILRPHGT
jgi:transcription elongation factor GreA